MRRTDSLEKTLMLGKIEGGRKGDNRGWDGWMASLIRWMWVWVSSGSWWWTGKPDVLQSTGSQRVTHDWATELNWSICASGLSRFSRVQLCDPMDCSPPGSSVQGILQARILEWVAMPSSRGSSQPRDQTHVSYTSSIGGRFFTTHTTRE